MKNQQGKLTAWVVRLLFFALTVMAGSSCGPKTNTFSAENTQTANNDAVIEEITDELDDMAAQALNTSSSSGSASGGRLEALTDDRLICSGTSIVFTDVATDRSSGTATITFPPEGCKDLKTNVRKGSMTIAWTGGKWYHQGASHTITLNNYSVNDIAITGTKTVACDSFKFTTATSFRVVWNVVANNTLTWPDATTATCQVNKVKKWDHGTLNEIYTYSNGTSATAASGTNRYGKAYSVSITTSLLYAWSCIKISKNFMPVTGVKVLTDLTKGKAINIDYGVGVCDNSYTVSVDGVKQTLHAKNDSSDD